MTAEERIWLKVSGVCGILTPIIAFTCILLAIASWPSFSWTDNALSDLGVQEGNTSVLFNFGLIISGVLALVFAFGLFISIREKAGARMGAFIFTLTALTLIAIGIFPETAKPMHFFASVAFFLFYPISVFFYIVTFFQMGKVKMCLFTLIAGIAATAAWVVHLAVRFGSGVAIPETIAALSASAWSMAMGCNMLMQALRSND